MRKMIGMACSLLAMLFPLVALAEAWDEAIGQPAPDISLICADGTSFSLSAALEEKELAVVCLFGSGCGACQKELRALNIAYQLYQDRVAVIALSLDRTRDTEEVLNAFQQAEGLLFPLGRDPARTARFLKINMYPAFMLVNQEGVVVYVEVNGPASIDHFVELFDAYLDNSNAQTRTGGETVLDVCTENSCPIPES